MSINQLQPIPTDLVVLEMANNHMGDVEHGREVIRQFGRVCKKFPEFNFAFKLQYRNLDTFIHPNLKGRTDIKHVKRFEETRLSRGDFDLLIEEMRENKFFTMATPFDEASVSTIVEQGLDIIKIASCSFHDWPLLEQVASTNLPIIASTAGATIEKIDQVVSFLQHRGKDFAIMHCVGEYPTPDEKMHVSQISFLKSRYPSTRIGFSTHEDPSNIEIIKLAIAKDADIFEKHVGVPTDTYSLNAYSSDPEQLQSWLEAARYAKSTCGLGDRRLPSNPQELTSLHSLQRGIFARKDIEANTVLTEEDIYFAFPPSKSQYTANSWSKYTQFQTSAAINKDAPITHENVCASDNRSLVWGAVEKVKALLDESDIAIPGGVDLEISHHLGMERFSEVGLTLITIVNRAYCKKLLVSLAGQHHPEQYHKQKEETFHILHGSIELSLNGNTNVFVEGDVINIEPGVRHAWVSKDGAIIEEISSTHFKNDSYYTDDDINRNENRKTYLTHWME